MTANAIGLGLIRVLPVTKLEITKSRSLVPYPRYWARVTNRHSLMGTSGKRRSLMGTSGKPTFANGHEWQSTFANGHEWQIEQLSSPRSPFRN